MQIGRIQLSGKVILAPMAGITDLPFRNLARDFGASLAVSEMVSVKPELQHTAKSGFRRQHEGENGIRAVQIVGTDALQMAEGAKLNVDAGAEMIDINMGCPAKKVCKKAAGSALLRDEKLVAEILEAVVAAVDVPVTLKMRTGWSQNERNAMTIARIAEDSGIKALAIHGRTRADGFRGEAEYETVAAVKQQVDIPVFVNGDIDTELKAERILNFTGADAVMVGRAAQGNPWLIQRMQTYLLSGEVLQQPQEVEVLRIMRQHLTALLAFYGEARGYRIARKHLGWYSKMLKGGDVIRSRLYEKQSANEQLEFINELIQIESGLGLAA